MTVNESVGASSSLSCASRSASVVGYAAARGVTGCGVSPSLTTPPVAGNSSVSPLNSDTGAVTSTKSPICGSTAIPAEPKTKMPSEASGVASVPPPVPSVCMKNPLKPPLG